MLPLCSVSDIPYSLCTVLQRRLVIGNSCECYKCVGRLFWWLGKSFLTVADYRATRMIDTSVLAAVVTVAVGLRPINLSAYLRP